MADDNDNERSPPRNFHVVGVGASAGGVAALRTLLSTLPPSPDVAFVVVVHLPADGVSRLPELLQPYTALPVRQLTRTLAIEPNRVYVIAPNANLESIDTHLRMAPLPRQRVDRAPIDHFLCTLAATKDGLAVGVILTGAGSDGTLGTRRVKESGGLTVAQDPAEAEYASMPENAVETGMVDLVLPVREIGPAILKFCATQPRLGAPAEAAALSSADEVALDSILRSVRSHTGQDLAVFERPVLLRRLRRRMRLRHLEDIGAYVEALSRHEDEASALVRDLMLNVTEFFREPDVFARLEHQVIPAILARKQGAQDRIRVWSVGCSSGEEAYSVAIVLLEQLARAAVRPQLQVFATESEPAIRDKAREGIYPAEVAASVSPERLEKFFVRQGREFVVRREVRERVVFAAHDLFKDPPYSRLDLIVCRSLLADLRPEIRRAVLHLFHYALEPNGFLIVGEGTPVVESELFACEDAGTDTYRRQSFGRVTLPRGSIPISSTPVAMGGRGATTTNVDVVAVHRQALAPHVPASALLDGAGIAQHYSGPVATFLRIPGGELTHELVQLVAEPLRPRLEAGLATVAQTGQPWRSPPMSVLTPQGIKRLMLCLDPVVARDGRRFTLVVFRELETADASPPLRDHEPAELIAHLEEQLHAANRSLREARRQAQDAPVRDGKIGDVLEQLEASREELEVVNEELTTLDDENRQRLEELTQLSVDLQHLLASTGVATVFLDRDLGLIRYTPQAAELFHLRSIDVRRRITDLAHELECPTLAEDLVAVMRHEAPMDREVPARDGRWFLARMLPYRVGSLVEGAVLTLVDISERKKTETLMRESERRKDEFLALLAHELRNPLAPITTGVEVLRRAADDPKVVRKMTDTIGRQTKQLVRLVDDLLEISRVSGGRLRLQRATTTLQDIVRDAIAAARPPIDGRGHRLEVELQDEPIYLEVDHARITQVIANLLTNAARYTPDAGLVQVSASLAQGDAIVRVRDTGIGIAADVLPHVFDMFYQVEDPRIARNSGLGIGLTLARSLVEMHGGSISASSAGHDAGSEFTVRLPIESSAARAAVPRSESLAKVHGRRVLIVDDNVDAAETLGMFMRGLGDNDVSMVTSGVAALEQAETMRPDLVLLDIKMPGLDGFEVARRMRARPWGRSLRLVALTGWAQEEHRQRAKEAGFDSLLSKPADVASLATLLRDLDGASSELPS